MKMCTHFIQLKSALFLTFLCVLIRPYRWRLDDHLHTQVYGGGGGVRDRESP